MSTSSTCLYGFSNTGVGRTPQSGVTKKAFFIPTNAAGTGNRNGIFMGNKTWTTNASFNQPAWGKTVAVTFLSTVGMYAGMVLNIPSSTPSNGWYQVQSITSGTVAVLMNIGQPPVSSIEGIAVATASVATLNGLVNGMFVDAFFQCLLNHPDPSQRLYASPELKEAGSKREDYIFQTFADNTKYVVHQGVRQWKGIIPAKNASAYLLGVLKTGWNLDMSLFEVDVFGNWKGTLMLDPASGLDIFYPTRIDSNSIAPNLNSGDDKTVQEITLAFDILSLEVDENIALLQGWNQSAGCGDISSNVNWSGYGGLLTVTSSFSNIETHSAGTFTMSLAVPGGTANQIVPDTGLIKSQMVSPNSGASGYVYDATADADVAITSVTEVMNAQNLGTGVYNIVLAADIATSLDKVAIGIVRPGRDCSSIPVAGGAGYSFISD